MQTGFFFSLDGIDGSGKSTQLSLFCEWLAQQGREYVVCRDPGSTQVGETIRGILLDRHDLAIHRRCEMFLYMAARTQLVEEIIRPALQRGVTVVSDRFVLANIVYQGHAGGLPIEETRTIGNVCTGGLLPDLTVVLDLDIELAGERLDRQRNQRDRMESQGFEFLSRVRQGFLAEAARDPERILIVDASAPPDEVQCQIRAAVQARLSTR